MVDDFARYTDRIISAVSMHFQLEPLVLNRRTGKVDRGNVLPSLHHIYVDTQQAFAGLFVEFTDPEKIRKAFTEYVRLVAAINGYVEFVPTRANFCAFLGMNTTMYARLLQDSPQDVRDAMQYVEDYFVSLLQIGSLNGNVGSDAARLVLQTAGQYGHNQVTVKEASEIQVNKVRMLGAEELEARLKRITSGK